MWLLFLPAMHGRDFGKRWVLYPEPIRESLLGWSGEAPREVKRGLAFSPELQSSATPCSRSWDVCRAGFVSSTAPRIVHARPGSKMIGEPKYKPHQDDCDRKKRERMHQEKTKPSRTLFQRPIPFQSSSRNVLDVLANIRGAVQQLNPLKRPFVGTGICSADHEYDLIGLNTNNFAVRQCKADPAPLLCRSDLFTSPWLKSILHRPSEPGRE